MFDSYQLARLGGCFTRLLPCFGERDVALAGGVAVEYHLAKAGRPALRVVPADVDLVARRVEGDAREIVRAFLVSHYHEPGAGRAKALLQLVDPPARLRIDVFPDTFDALVRARSATIGGASLPVLDPRDILAHKIETIRKASAASPADPKHWRDAAALAPLCGVVLPPLSPHLRTAVLSTDPGAVCERCERSRSADFPLADKREIFDLLGYV